MPVLTGNQVRGAPAQTARVAVRATFGGQQPAPAGATLAPLDLSAFPAAEFEADQVAAQPRQAPRLALARWRGPAAPRPPGVPATPRPY